MSTGWAIIIGPMWWTMLFWFGWAYGRVLGKLADLSLKGLVSVARLTAASSQLSNLLGSLGWGSRGHHPAPKSLWSPRKLNHFYYVGPTEGPRGFVLVKQFAGFWFPSGMTGHTILVKADPYGCMWRNPTSHYQGFAHTGPQDSVRRG